jgi:D-lactate dehydrogenase
VLLPKLSLVRLEQDVVLHPNCSAQRLGLGEEMAAIARACARSVSIPLELGCCASAGDRGLLYPELTASATAQEAAEVGTRSYDGYYSSNIACEIGMSQASGETYRGLVYLVERASRPTIRAEES